MKQKIKFSNNSGFTPIILVFSLILLSLGSYFIWYNLRGPGSYKKIIANCIASGGTVGESAPPRCMKPFSDWKTYKNPDLGIEFKYRPDLTVEYDNKSKSVLLNNKTTSVSTNYDTFFSASIGELDLKGMTAKSYALNRCNTSSENNSEMWVNIRRSCKEGVEKSYETYASTNISGVKFKYNPYENTELEIIFSIKGGPKTFYLVSSTETGGSGPTEMGLKTIDQILSTFKFIQSEAVSGQVCGGIANLKCSNGFTCQITDTYPDASGTCVSDTSYKCRANGWVDCMPVLDGEKKVACSVEAMAWYKVNCPDFKGAAL